MSGLPDHVWAALDAIGVRMPDRAPVKRAPPPPVDQWWKRGEECPH